MKINAALVVQARKQRSWSQEELAIASGLNLRTIQRIESAGSASLQSVKALAAALDAAVQDLSVPDLGREETHKLEHDSMAQNWEYKVIETKDRSTLQSELDRAGADGWELVSSTSMFNTLMTKVVHTLFLKRPGPRVAPQEVAPMPPAQAQPPAGTPRARL